MCEGEGHGKAAAAAEQSSRHSVGAARYVRNLYPVTYMFCTAQLSSWKLADSFHLLCSAIMCDTMARQTCNTPTHKHLAQMMTSMVSLVVYTCSCAVPGSTVSACGCEGEGVAV